jgi:hypothetical protein
MSLFASLVSFVFLSPRRAAKRVQLRRSLRAPRPAQARETAEMSQPAAVRVERRTTPVRQSAPAPAQSAPTQNLPDARHLPPLRPSATSAQQRLDLRRPDPFV